MGSKVCYLWKWCLCVVVFSCMKLAAAFTKTYTMSEYCGDLIDFEYKHLSSINLRLTEASVYSPHMSCKFAVRAPPQHRLTMVVEWLDIARGRFYSCADYLTVSDGDLFNKTGTVVGLNSKICGDQAPASVVSQGRALSLYFDSNTLNHGKGFFITFTAFREGECSRNEFTCDNGRCIDNRLKCDEYDNCGDDSDDCILTVGEVVLAVVITTLIFFLIVGAAVLYCHRDKLCKGRKKCPIIGANPDGVYQPTTEPVTAGASENTTAV